MRFEFLFRVSPPSYFGLPEDGKTVIKATPGRQMYGPTVDSRSGKVVAYGTLPEYRPDQEAVKLTLSHAGVDLRVTDNYFRLAVLADDLDSAHAQAAPIIERLIRFLGVEFTQPFEFEPLQVDSPEPLAWPGPRPFQLVNVTLYNLEECKVAVARSFERSTVVDPRLDKALIYYEHALFLYNARGHAAPQSAHEQMLVASAFLHLWKSISAVLGEPGSDRDYQSRYRQFGLPEGFWTDRVEPLYRIRNEADVAHYSLDPQSSAPLERSFGSAAKVCQEVLIAFCEHIRTGR